MDTSHQQYKGKYANICDFILLPNSSVPVDNTEILSSAKESKDDFYAQNNSVLKEIQASYIKNNK